MSTQGFRDGGSPNLELLLTALIEGQITPAETTELNRLLAADPSARRRYLRYIFLHGDLGWDLAATRAQEGTPIVSAQAETVDTCNTWPEVASSSSSSIFLRERTSKRRSVRFTFPARQLLKTAAGAMQRSFAFWVLVATVSVVAVLLIRIPLPLVTKTDLSRPNETVLVAPIFSVARFTNGTDCRWGEPSKDISLGSNLSSGQVLDLREGLAELTFNSGAVALVEGPARFTIEGANQGKLDRGKLVARAEKTSAAGFSVTTPMTTVVDLGTEFGVSVAEGGKVDVVVLQGMVRAEMHRPSPNQGSSTVTAGHSISIRTSTTGEAQVVRDAPIGERFARAIPSEFPEQSAIAWNGSTSPVDVGFEPYFQWGDLSDSCWTFDSPKGFATQKTPPSDYGRYYQLPHRSAARLLDNAKGWSVEFRLKVIDATHRRDDGYYFNVGVAVGDSHGLLFVGLCPHSTRLLALFNPQERSASRVPELDLSKFHAFRITRERGNTYSFRMQIDGGEPFEVSSVSSDEGSALRFGDLTKNPGVGHAVWEYVRVNDESKSMSKSESSGHD